MITYTAIGLGFFLGAICVNKHPMKSHWNTLKVFVCSLIFWPILMPITFAFNRDKK